MRKALAASVIGLVTAAGILVPSTAAFAAPAVTLAATGITVPPWVLWGAGGFVVLGAFLLWWGSRGRRRRRHRATD